MNASDPRSELDALRAHLEDLAVAVVAAAAAPDELAPDAAIRWHVASAALAKLTSAFLDGAEEQLDALEEALLAGCPPCPVISLDAYRRRLRSGPVCATSTPPTRGRPAGRPGERGSPGA